MKNNWINYKINILWKDVDECADSALNICSAESDCINSFGSFSCKCKTGYEKTGFATCADIDECALG